MTREIRKMLIRTRHSLKLSKFFSKTDSDNLPSPLALPEILLNAKKKTTTLLIQDKRKSIQQLTPFRKFETA